MTEKKSERFLSTSTILNIVTIFVPFAYLTGYFYDIGYLDTYGFPADAFPKSVEIYLINFFIAITSILAKIISMLDSGWNVLLFFIFATIIGLIFAVCDRLMNKNKSSIDKLKSKVRSYKNLDLTLFPLMLGTFFVIIPYTLIILLVFLILGLYSGHHVGREAALQELKKFSCKPSSNCSTLYSDGKSIAEGKVIATSDTYIGIYTENGAYLIPNSNITIKNHPRHD